MKVTEEKSYMMCINFGVLDMKKIEIILQK